MADVFLSYARANLPTAKRVAGALQSAGFFVWFDENLPAHRAYSEVIEEQLDTALAVLVLWSKDAARSQWVRSEANRARESARLVQVRIDDARLPMPFDQIQCADLRKWSGDASAPAWQSVLTSVSALAADGSSAMDRPIAQLRVPPEPVQRRQLLLGGAAVAVLAAAGIAGWRAADSPEVPPEAKLFLQKGYDALQNNDALDPQGPGSTLQAIALLTQATEAAPQSAEAWGALAMAYAVRKKVAPLAERSGLEMRARSSARTALRLHSTESRALAALLLIEPLYRNWLAAEQDAREAVQKNSTTPILSFIASNVLGQVGRWADAVEFSSRLDRRRFLLPGGERKLLVDLWASGDLDRADRALKLVTEHWPQHPQVWQTCVSYLMYSGRPQEALELLRDGVDRPSELTQEYLDAARATAEALAGQRAASDAMEGGIDYLRRNPAAALPVAQAAAALNFPETALRILDGYYFAEGEWSELAPAAGDQDRITSPLFQPPMRLFWRDGRFDRLLERIGLNEYWRRSRTLPDFRRTA